MSLALLEQNFEDKWLRVLSRDVQQQQESQRPQEPFSDAYLTGMPSKRRRCIHAMRPPTTLDGFVAESMRAATSQTLAQDPEARGWLVQAVRDMVSARAAGDQDFAPERHTAAARLLAASGAPAPTQPST